MVRKSFPIQASVIICTYRRNKVLVETIDRVIAQADGLAEVLVVDQKAQHDSATREFLMIKSDEGLIRYFNLDVAGLTHARNFGAAQARGALLLFCDDDVVPCPNWIREHIAVYQDGQVSAVAGQVLNVGGCANDAPGAYSHNQPIPSFSDIHGANFSVRKSVYESIGGSDEKSRGACVYRRLDSCGTAAEECTSDQLLSLGQRGTPDVSWRRMPDQ
jgi:glycosyltransferase involved in cell wall biosynthesis